jgi:hypothetical protein
METGTEVKARQTRRATQVVERPNSFTHRPISHFTFHSKPPLTLTLLTSPQAQQHEAALLSDSTSPCLQNRAVVRRNTMHRGAGGTR